jgi:MFS family permease
MQSMNVSRTRSVSVVIRRSSLSFPDSAGSQTVRSPSLQTHIQAPGCSESRYVTCLIDLWLQGIAVLLPQINTQFNPPRVEYTTLALFVGLICGAVTWGSLSDIIGRKLSWQITLCIAVSDPTRALTHDQSSLDMHVLTLTSPISNRASLASPQEGLRTLSPSVLSLLAWVLASAESEWFTRAYVLLQVC